MSSSAHIARASANTDESSRRATRLKPKNSSPSSENNVQNAQYIFRCCNSPSAIKPRRRACKTTANSHQLKFLRQTRESQSIAHRLARRALQQKRSWRHESFPSLKEEGEEFTFNQINSHNNHEKRKKQTNKVELRRLFPNRCQRQRRLSTAVLSFVRKQFAVASIGHPRVNRLRNFRELGKTHLFLHDVMLKFGVAHGRPSIYYLIFIKYHFKVSLARLAAF